MRKWDEILSIETEDDHATQVAVYGALGYHFTVTQDQLDNLVTDYDFLNMEVIIKILQNHR